MKEVHIMVPPLEEMEALSWEEANTLFPGAPFALWQFFDQGKRREGFKFGTQLKEMKFYVDIEHRLWAILPGGIEYLYQNKEWVWDAPF